MKLNKKYFNFVYAFLFFLIGISLISSFTISSIGSNSQASSNGDSSLCQQAQDLVIQVAPFGCSPLRTDLLEEQDVTVYCKLQAMKINPLVNVKSIDSISFSNKNYSPQISSVAFFPANAYSGNKEVLTSSLFNDIGFLAVTVKKQTNHSLIPELISGTLTAQVKYNMGEEFGIGKTSFYLRGVEENSQENNEAFSFWDNIGHLKLQTIDNEKAEISVYFSDREIETVTLKKGETSNKIILPTSQCGSGLNLKLEDFNSLATTAKIRVDSEVVEVAKGEKFLNNKCFVKEIINNGLSKYVKISCKDNKGNQELSLSITPKVNLSIAGQIKSYELGDYLFDSDGKKVYLIYIGGKEGDLLNNENLILFFAALPKSDTNRLSQSELSSFKEVIAPIAKEKLDEKDNGILRSTSKILTDFGTALNQKFTKAFTGEEVLKLEFNQELSYKGKKISISSLASAQDEGISDPEKEGYYKNAFEEYQKLIDDFSDTNYGLDKLGDEITYGEKAFRNQIFLASSAGQKATLEELCSKFKEDYANKDLPSECSPNKILNSQISESYLTIEGENRRFSLESIYEPGFNEYGVKIKITNLKNNQETEYNLEKDKAVSFPGLNGYLILTEIKDENSATIFFSLDDKTKLKKLREDLDLVSDKKTLQKNIGVQSEELDYNFIITQINLKKSAKVTLNSDAAKLGTKTNFSFKIEIEDRNIQLSPEMTNKTIDFLNKSINTLTGVSNFLNSWVEIQTGACYATAGLLTINSFFQGNVAGFNARQTIMRGINGWMERCNNLVKNGEYASSSACLLAKSDTIDKQVEELSQSIETQGKNIDSLSASIKQTSSIKAQEELVSKYCSQVQTLLTNLPKEKLDSLNIVNEDIYMLKLENWKIGKFTIDQLKSIGTYANLLAKTSDSELQNLAKSELTSLFEKIKQTAKIEEQANSFFSTYGIEKGIVQDLTKFPTIKLYSVQKRSEMPSSLNTLFSSSLDSDDYVQGIYDFNKNEKYLIGIDSSNLKIKSTYILQDDGKLIAKETPLNLKIEFYAKTEYNNVYVNPELKYYDTEPYKGLPAVVPVDVKQGWYAVIKQTTSFWGNIPSYDDSGKIKSFYLGNVGTNGKFEFEVNGGDDTYKSINLDSVDPYSFPGLTPSKAKEIIRKAEESIKQAEAIKESQRKGKVKINGQEVNIGQAAASSIQMSCEDVLSPKECAVLFNVCDPVICPASRCDFFGTYKNNPQNVKQKGIIGGLTFCLGNFVGFGGDVILPVCVDGVKAGVDNLISVFNETSKCLKKSLETGENVGVCDEIQSVYLCDLVWREFSSLTGDLVSLGLNSLGKKNDKKGGEYFSLQEQVSLAQNTMNFFLNSYSSDLQKTFLTKTTKEIGTGICKSFVSGVFPSGSEILSQIVKSESPVQFTGHFDEIVSTTATVPAISHYKVFYHIYAGKDSVAYYSIYLRATQTSNSNPDKLVDSGTIEIGGSLTETKDLTASAGYNQLCINVNGQEECGFREVSTSFGIDAIKEMYVSELSGKTQIVSEKDCRSGTILTYGIELYNQGIIRECSTSNPGISTDPYINTEKSRWKEVGYCGDNNIKCWIDTNSIKDTLEIGGLEDKAIDEITESDLAALGLEGYLTSEKEIQAKIKEIEQQDEKTKEGLLKRISLIDAIIDKVAILKYKTKLLLLKGDAYKLLFGLKIVKATPTSTTQQTTFGECFSEKTFNSVDEVRKAILTSAKALSGEVASRCLDEKYFSDKGETGKEPCIFLASASCWDGAYEVYKKANVGFYPLYTDVAGKKYTFSNALTNSQTQTADIGNNWKTPFNVDSVLKNWEHNSNEDSYNEEDEKLALLKPGDLLSLVWNGHSGHNVVFLEWVNEKDHIAKLFDFNDNVCLKDKSGNILGGFDKEGDCNYITKKFRCFEWDISDNSHPVYQIWQPAGSGSQDSSLTKPTVNPDKQGSQDKVKPSGESDNKENEKASSSNCNSDVSQKLASELDKLDSNKISLQDLFKKVGVKGFEDSDFIKSTEYFLNALRSNENYLRIEPKDLQKGDLIIIGKECDKNYKFGIFKEFVTEKNQLKIKYFSPVSINSNPTISSVLTVPISLSSIQDYYVYAAYTYVGDLPSACKTQSYVKYDVYGVIDNINKLIKEEKITSDSSWLSQTTPNYAEGEPYTEETDSALTNSISRLVVDDILTEDQCSNLWGKFLFFRGSSKSVKELIPLIFSNSKIQGEFLTLYMDTIGKIIKENYVEINPSKAAIGDIVQIKKSCDEGTSNIGIITYGNDKVQKAFENSNDLGSIDKIGIGYLKDKQSSLNYKEILPNFMGKNSKEEYIYKVYSRKGSVSSTETSIDSPLTLAQASKKMDTIYNSYNSLSKEYNSIFYEVQKNFPVKAYSLIKEIILSKLLTEQECESIFFSGDAAKKTTSIEFVKNLLSIKCNKDSLCSKEKGENQNSGSDIKVEGNTMAEKALNLLQNTYFGQSQSIASILELSGVDIDKRAGLQITISHVLTSPYFSKIDLSTLKPGDIVLYGNGCDIKKNMGIVKSVSGDNVEYYLTSLKDNKIALTKNVILTAKEINLDWGKMSKGYIYAAYRYNKDLSNEDKNAIVKDIRTIWTLNSAYSFAKNQYTSEKDSGYVSILNPPSYKTFVLQTLYDGVLTPLECDSVVNEGEGAAVLIDRFESRMK